MQIGIDSFVEISLDPSDGGAPDQAQRVRDLLEEIELADQVGLDVFGIGEHHRQEFVASAPSVILAAAAARTKRIRLTSAVSVLSSEDPVRLFQQFRNPGSDLSGASRDHCGSRLIYRVVSTLWIRPP
jgi:alkanesulfonate monooxygenase SsuD/methylene tetrahydromethanopterin reductase-like flavin-dependent oxidoreductase (luciferase family)